MPALVETDTSAAEDEPPPQASSEDSTPPSLLDDDEEDDEGYEEAAPGGQQLRADGVGRKVKAGASGGMSKGYEGDGAAACEPLSCLERPGGIGRCVWCIPLGGA